MVARPESDETLEKRLLPQVNADSHDRATAWSEWYIRGGELSVLGFIKAKNDSPEADMDIFQEAMLTAFVELERGRYKPRQGIPFAAYVKGIAWNKIREARRRLRRLIPIEETPPSLLGSDDARLENMVERQEQGHALHASLMKLTACRRQVLEGYLSGASTREIAQMMGITEALVRQHKSRGLRRLREMNIFQCNRQNT